MAETMLPQISSVAGGSALESLLHALDPISLLLSQNPVSQSVPESMERGPRYKAYAELRESKLRNKYLQMSPDQPLEEEEEKESKPTPTKKQVKFQANLISGPRRKGPASSSCVVAQSVPDFSAVLRKEKENRKPPTARLEMTPPWSKGNHGGAVSNSRGSKSASAGEKNRCNGGGGGGLMARKSYASLEELKGLSSAAGNAIIGGGAENRAGGRSGRATARAVLGYRHF